jgi:hypothetical protein
MASFAETGRVRSPWRLSWTAIIAGALLAIAAHIVLGLIGTALGLAAAPADSKALGAGAAAWALLTPFVASLLGAWFACRLCGATDTTTANVHAILPWCIGLIAGAIFLTGTLASGAMTAGAAASGNAGTAERVRREATGQRAPGGREAQARSEDAAKAAAAGTGGAALAAIAGLVGAVAGAGLSTRRPGRRGGWRAAFERRHDGAHPAASSLERERQGTYSAEARPYGTGVERGPAAPGDAGASPRDPSHH